tara:strand:+ start:1592 stop:2815 length:1224 start_codon:yes stop_codon:yes gene_type:complete
MQISICRSCKSKNIKDAFSLGSQVLTGVFPSNKKMKISKGKLSLVHCEKCSLLQLKNSFNANEMYGDNYGYMSSLNKSMFFHLKNKVNILKRKINLNYQDIIIDIGSNDGTFLSFFDQKFNLIGVDPTIRKFGAKYKKGIKKIPNFFSYDVVKKYLKKKKAKLITSIAMFYDLDDPFKFVRDIHESLDDNGVWHFEQSYMPYMIKNTSYDTICHEHLEYYSLKSVKYILDEVGFKIIDIELNSINGGSFALTVAKQKSKYQQNKKIVEWLLYKEKLFNFNNLETFKKFYINALKQKKLLRNLLYNLKDMKKLVLGYGASTKGNVILQFCGINSKILPYIGEVNSFKYNKLTPGTNIKIISEKQAKQMNPDYFLVLPWHFREFILNKEKLFLQNKGKLIFPLPDLEMI